MINIKLLKKAGVDYDAGIKRFMNDLELYEAVLSAFVHEDILERARDAFGEKDCRRLLDVVHEAKGAGGNAGLDGIFIEASAVVTLLRRGSYTENDLAESFRRFEKVYSDTREGIRLALK